MSAGREICGARTEAAARARHRLDATYAAFLTPPTVLSQAAASAGVSVSTKHVADEAINWASRPVAAAPEVSAWTASLSTAALSTIRGGRDAQRLVATIREGCAPADALLEGLRAIAATEDDDRLRGACRGLQKALEGRT